MGIEQLMQAVLMATPAVRRRLEAVLNGTDTQQTEKISENDSHLLTITETAKLLGIGRSCVYALIEDGRLDAVMLNGNRRIVMKSIREFTDGARPANEKTEERMKGFAETYAKRQAQKEGRGE